MDARQFKPGDRVRLTHMEDPYRKDVPIGITGTVTGIAPPPINVLDGDWDGNFHLNPCLDVDRVTKL